MPIDTPTPKSAMTRAWELARQMDAAFVRMCGGIKNLFGGLLRQAWSEIKTEATAKPMTAVEASSALNMLRNKDRWSEADHKEADRLTRIVREAAAEKVAELAEKRELIAAASRRPLSVYLLNSDGEESSVSVRSIRPATYTAETNNPHLLKVWDVHAKAPCLLNLANIKTITIDGMAHAYQ